jgi:hypothetical protein
MILIFSLLFAALVYGFVFLVTLCVAVPFYIPRPHKHSEWYVKALYVLAVCISPFVVWNLAMHLLSGLFGSR